MDIENFFKKTLFKKKYHIIFFDPPYKDYEYKRIFKIIIKKNILDKEHIVIIHREKNAEESMDECLNIIEIWEIQRLFKYSTDGEVFTISTYHKEDFDEQLFKVGCDFCLEPEELIAPIL